MSTTMRAKFRVESISDIKTEYNTNQTLVMYPVSTGTFGPNGESEDNTFARFTPCGKLELNITNPDLKDKIQPGEVYYLDFTKA